MALKPWILAEVFLSDWADELHTLQQVFHLLDKDSTELPEQETDAANSCELHNDPPKKATSRFPCSCLSALSK